MYNILNQAVDGSTGFNNGSVACTFGTMGGFPYDCFENGKYLVALNVEGCSAETAKFVPFSRHVDIYVLEN